MNKFMVLCLLCVGPLVAQALRITGNDFEESRHVLDSSDDNMVDRAEVLEPNPMANVPDINMIENCFIKILSPSITCIMSSLSTWNVDVFQLKHAVNHKPTCCATWQITDCLVNKAKVYCTPEENLEFNLHMTDLTSKRNEYNCTQFQYQSNTCHEPTDEESRDKVLTNVLVREEEQTVNDQTVDEVIEKRVAKSEDQLPLDDLGEFKLAQRLLDRVNRITIHRVVIDLHPVKNDRETKTHETDTSSKVDSYFDP